MEANMYGASDFELERWLESLARDHQKVARTALNLHRNFVMPRRFVGGCYLLAFFLSAYLKREEGILVRPVVGYAWDQGTPARMSHAWVDFEGTITDISLTITEVPEVQIPGQLTILGRVIQPGRAEYTYHLKDSTDSIDSVAKAITEVPQLAAVLAMKRREHEEMSRLAENQYAIEQFLKSAPPHLSYEVLARASRSRGPQ